MFAVRTSLLAVFTLASCAMEDVSNVETYLGCPGSVCNSNSPVMGPYSYWEGNLAGLPNDQGVKFGDFVSSTDRHCTPKVVGDKFQAFCPASPLFGPALTLMSAALQNGYLEAFTAEGTYKIKFVTVHSNTYTFWQGPTTAVETYELRYEKPTGGGFETLLCNNPPAGNRTPAGNGRMWTAPLEAVLFTGDRYDEKTRRVTDISATGTQNWFNIGCAGSGLMKLHLNRHSTAGSVPGYTTTQNARQAMFKMFSSDLFGDGTIFTHQGVLLDWENRPRWSMLTGHEFAFEARWDQNGAQCLDTHRLGDTLVELIRTHGEEIGRQLKPCAGNVANPTYWPNTLFITAVPVAP
jgi:ADYC domain